jgi:hypothetical protein
MKKIILVIIVFACVAFFGQSCTKSCTCINPDTQKPTEVEIDPSKKCSDQSNSTLGDCS